MRPAFLIAFIATSVLADFPVLKVSCDDRAYSVSQLRFFQPSSEFPNSWTFTGTVTSSGAETIKSEAFNVKIFGPLGIPEVPLRVSVFDIKPNIPTNFRGLMLTASKQFDVKNIQLTCDGYRPEGVSTGPPSPSWTGKGQKETESFYVTSRKWSLRWACDGYLGVQVCSEDDSRCVSVINTSKSTDSTVVRLGPGKFYLKVNATDQWSLSVD